jgi:predicted nucleic acid-binding protein
LAFAIIDTNVYIDDWQGKLQDGVLADIRQQFVVRQSAVVLSELRRGARDKRAQRLVNELQVLATTLWEPTAADWWLAGDLTRTVGDAQGWETSKRREFQNDALIALTARHYGAAVVTTNAKDFLLLAKRIKVQVLDVAP